MTMVRSPAAMNIVMRQGWMALGVSIAAMIGSGMLVRSIPYQVGSNTVRSIPYQVGSNTVGPRSSDPIYIVSYDIKWVTTFWTYSK